MRENNNFYGDHISRLISSLAALPGIGGKSAQRLAFHMLSMDDESVDELVDAIKEAKKNVKYCSVCCNLTDEDPCYICASPDRDKSVIMVVEEPKDMAAYEKTREYKGSYHVLGGVISPMAGTGPENLKIKELLNRMTDEVKEVILATNLSIEGEATAIYISRLLKPLGIKVTRIANGVPVGGSLEYTDEVTLSRALELRREI